MTAGAARARRARMRRTLDQRLRLWARALARGHARTRWRSVPKARARSSACAGLAVLAFHTCTLRKRVSCTGAPHATCQTSGKKSRQTPSVRGSTAVPARQGRRAGASIPRTLRSSTPTWWTNLGFKTSARDIAVAMTTQFRITCTRAYKAIISVKRLASSMSLA